MTSSSDINYVHPFISAPFINDSAAVKGAEVQLRCDIITDINFSTELILSKVKLHISVHRACKQRWNLAAD